MALTIGIATPAVAADTSAIERAAHGGYIAVINSNDVAVPMADLTDDIDRKSAAVSTDVGDGVNIFRRGADGKWRVAVNGWSSDKPAAP